MQTYSLVEAKRTAKQAPLIVFFNAELSEKSIIVGGFAIISPVRPGSKLSLFVDNEIIGVIIVPELPSVFSLERMELSL